AYILDHNPRGRFPLVDDKLRMRDLCVRIGVPTPEIYAQVACNAELRRLAELLRDLDDFVIKPNRGSAGRGVLVLQGRRDTCFLRHNGEGLTLEQLRQHLPDTGVPIVGRRVPFWNDVLELAQRVARAVGLGYLGVDIVIDELHGPMLLEANARPGLAIQIANGCGLAPRLLAIERQQDGKSAEGNDKSSPMVLPMKRAFRRSA